MKQVLIRKGDALVEEVPSPTLLPGTVLVQVDHSCVSVGSERSGLATSGESLLRKALKKPDQVKKVLTSLRSNGLASTRSLVEGKVASAAPTGYSVAGVVLAVADDVRQVSPGDRVACAGAQCAHHAEVVRVPINLLTPVPPGVALSDASTVALGAIALQGVRRAAPTLGETFVVIGLGVLGQLTAQMLRANGCRVIGTDLDPGRLKLAEEQGLEQGICAAEEDPVSAVTRLSSGVGADGVIITAATASSAIVEEAFRMCRRKARVVLVGDVGLDLRRDELYRKELDFLISTSYGPGRYDENYEEGGADYPLPYVRWTENRNMAQYLRLLAAGQVRIGSLVTRIEPMAEASRLYRDLQEHPDNELFVLFSYPQDQVETTPVVCNPGVLPPRGEAAVRLALAGAGSFARTSHLPNLKGLSSLYHLQAVVSRTGTNAMAAARQFGAGYATTDFCEVLRDPQVEAVLIATRHNQHAQMVIDALEAGKHVLVEKPLALSREDLERIEVTLQRLKEKGILPLLLTGFNRRFSPHISRVSELVAGRSHPMIINYRMNAGYIPGDHWVHTAEGGGRNLGEACHIYDLFTYLVGVPVVSVVARALGGADGPYRADDNFVATLGFEDGSVATLTYTALGSSEYPKEAMEVFFDGKVLHLEDYRRLSVHGSSARGMETRRMEKGQRQELEAFALALRTGGDWPIPLWQQLQATRIALDVEDQLS